MPKPPTHVSSWQLKERFFVEKPPITHHVCGIITNFTLINYNFCRMKTFILIVDIVIAILIVVFGVFFVIDYHKTKDSTEISPEELKQLRKTNFFLIMLLCLTILVEHIDRIFPS